MLSKTYGLFYKNGRWYVRSYGREIKGGMIGLRARITSWSRNRRGEGKIIELKRIVPQPWDKEEYEPTVGPGENERFAGPASISASEAHQDKGLNGASILGHVTEVFQGCENDDPAYNRT